MQQECDFFKESTTLVYSTIKAALGNRLIMQDDIESITLTIYEQDSPLSVGSPVPFYDKRAIDKMQCVWDILQNGELEDKYGIRTIQYNFAYIIAHDKMIVNGETEKIYPFPNIGKCYKVLFEFVSASADFPDFAAQWIGYAV